MSEPISKAKELGNAIIHSSEFIQYQKAKERLEDKQMLDKAALYEQSKAIVDSGKFHSESKLYIDAAEVIDSTKESKELMDYFDAKEKLSRLLESVNQILSHITGMDTGRGGCGDCGGCR